MNALLEMQLGIELNKILVLTIIIIIQIFINTVHSLHDKLADSRYNLEIFNQILEDCFPGISMLKQPTIIYKVKVSIHHTNFLGAETSI